MPAPKGNKFWEARSRHGRKPIFESPEMLWEGCVDYFTWVEENPLLETKVFHAQGQITKTEVPKMRAMTISGLCLFLDISEDTWANYRQQKDFIGVIRESEKIIYNQKFQGAAADFLNANIIARDLGLKDKQELSGDPKRPVQIIGREMTSEEAEKVYNEIID